MSEDQKAHSIIKEAGLTGVSSVTKNKSGYASQSYVVTCDQGELVVLVPRSGGIEQPDYAYHHVILQQLQAIDYPYAPRPVYLAKDHNSIIITKVAGESSIWLNDAPVEQQKQAVKMIIDALLELSTVSFEVVSSAYKELTGRTLKTVKIQDNVKKFQTDWIKLADERGRPDEEVKSWLTPRVKECKDHVRNLPVGGKIVFTHGDTVAGNLFFTQDMRLSFIDWDSSDFEQYPEDLSTYNLGYILLQVPYFSDNREYTLDYLAEQAGLNRAELENRVIRSQRITQISDVTWAYMMHARAITGDVDGDPAKFLKIAHERIAYYKEHFTSK